MSGFTPTVRVEYRDLGLKKILANVRQLDVERLRVGVVGPKASEPSGDGRRTVAVAAIINHYGSDDGVVPPRPFLTQPYQTHRARVTSLMREAARSVFGPTTGVMALDRLGQQLSKLVRDEILNNHIKPSNAPRTIAKKGFDHALVWTFKLAGAISHRIVRASGSVLEAGAGDYEHFEIGGGGIPGTGPYGGD